MNSVTGVERNKAVVRAFVAAINAQDWQRLDELVSDDVVRHSQTADRPLVCTRDELKTFLVREAATFPDAHESIELLVGESDLVAARMRFTGTQRGPLGPFPPSGKALAAHFLCMFRIDGDRIREIWVEWDNLNALEQLGHIVLPSDTAAGFSPPRAQSSQRTTGPEASVGARRRNARRMPRVP
jgi:steroid delta-isomerase-like uncharacterized protein